MSSADQEKDTRFNRAREEEAVLREDFFGHFLRFLGGLSVAVDHLVVFGLCLGLAFLSSAGAYYVGEPVIMGDYGWAGTILGALATVFFAAFTIIGLAGAILIPLRWLTGARKRSATRKGRGNTGS